MKTVRRIDNYGEQSNYGTLCNYSEVEKVLKEYDSELDEKDVQISLLKARIMFLEEGLKDVRNAVHCTPTKYLEERCNKYLKPK